MYHFCPVPSPSNFYYVSPVTLTGIVDVYVLNMIAGDWVTYHGTHFRRNLMYISSTPTVYHSSSFQGHGTCNTPPSTLACQMGLLLCMSYLSMANGLLTFHVCNFPDINKRQYLASGILVLRLSQPFHPLFSDVCWTLCIEYCAVNVSVEVRKLTVTYSLHFDQLTSLGDNLLLQKETCLMRGEKRATPVLTRFILVCMDSDNLRRS